MKVVLAEMIGILAVMGEPVAKSMKVMIGVLRLHKSILLREPIKGRTRRGLLSLDLRRALSVRMAFANAAYWSAGAKR